MEVQLISANRNEQTKGYCTGAATEVIAYRSGIEAGIYQLAHYPVIASPGSTAAIKCNNLHYTIIGCQTLP